MELSDTGERSVVLSTAMAVVSLCVDVAGIRLSVARPWRRPYFFFVLLIDEVLGQDRQSLSIEVPGWF